MDGKISYTMLAASVIMLATTLLHALAGTSDVMGPILGSDLHPVVIATSYVVWHMITLMLGTFAAALGWLTRKRSRPLVLIILTSQIGFAAIFIMMNIAFFQALFVMPQWTIFAVTAALIVIGNRQKIRAV